MIVKISQKSTNQIALHDEQDNLLKEFEIKENLQRTLGFLKKLNLVKTIDGLPVYQTRVFKGISVWSFSQHNLFWRSLRWYVKYEEIIKFLIENKIEKVIIDDSIKDLQKYLKINEIKIINDSVKSEKIRSFFVYPLMKTIAIIMTLLAFLKLFFSETTILVYTPDKFSKKHDGDFRFYSVYQYLKEKKLPYVEIFHTLLNYEFFKNILARRRTAFYIEAFPIISPRKEDDQKYDLSIFEPHNQKYFQHILKLVDQGSKNSIKRIQILTRFLKFTKIKTLLAIDDLRYTNELILACKLNKIKTYGFQHGQLSKYQVGWLNYNIPKEVSLVFDKLFVWNDYWKKVLLTYSTQYNEVNVGIGELSPKSIAFKKKEFKIGRISELNILIPYEALAPKKEVGDFLNRFINLDVKIFFKLRPDQSIDKQFEQYQIKGREKVVVIREINEDILSRIDAVAGTYSTLLFEMIYYEKPVFIFETSFDYGCQLIDDNLGILIKKDFTPSFLLDCINNYQSKKNQAWPPAETNLRENLDKLDL